MAAQKLAPVRPHLDALLAQRDAPWSIRRPLARAVAEVVAQRKPYQWARLLEWLCLMTTDLPRPPRPTKGAPMPGGIVVNEEELSPEERRPAVPSSPGLTPEQQELTARRAERTHQATMARTRWLEQSGFAAVIEKAEALLADLPRALAEHQRAQAALGDLATFLALAAEAPDDPVLQRLARGAQDLAQQIARPPLLAENAGALRELIARVRGADLEGVNGVKNGNVTAAWRRRFTELVSPLPGLGYAERCRRAVKGFLAEARKARRGQA